MGYRMTFNDILLLLATELTNTLSYKTELGPLLLCCFVFIRHEWLLHKITGRINLCNNVFNKF